MAPMDESVREFLIEGHENLAQIEQLMLMMESGSTPESRSEAVQSAFRLLHSIKGAAGFLGLRQLEALSHGAESLLARIRSGELVPDGTHFAWLLQAIDGLKALLGAIENTGSDEIGRAHV